MLKTVPKEQVLDRIRFENPWWVDGRIEKEYENLPRRPYLKLFSSLVYEKEVRRALILMGPRRVGKTVLLHHMIQEMIEKGHKPMKIIFVTIENPVYNNIGLEKLFSYAKEASGLNDAQDWVIFFDEIQYCRDWEIHLKTLVDSYPNDKFVVSGSAAAALKYASMESGAGRFTDFLLPPLTFHEYISLKGFENLIKPTDIIWNHSIQEFYTTAYTEELNKHFVDYINYGGYPEVIFSEKIRANPGRYIRQDIIDKVLLRDLPSIYGIADTRELNSLFTTIAYNSGVEFSLEALSKQSQIPKNTIKKYIDYLEAAYLVSKVRRIDQSAKRFKRDNFFKIYLTNPSLRTALFSPLSANHDMIGHLVETTVFAQWMHKKSFTPWYGRWKNGEVDMVGLGVTLKPQWALEIKWSNRYFSKPSTLKNLSKFCSDNNLDYPIVTTIDKEGQAKHLGKTYQFLPASCLAYSIGKKTLETGSNFPIDANIV